MIKNMDMESTHIQMEEAIKVNGQMANSMEKAFLSRHKVQRRKGFGRMEKGCNGLTMMNDRIRIFTES